MSEFIDKARNSILVPAGLDENTLNKVLSNIMGNGVDFSDLYFQNTRNESWVLEDGIIKEGGFSVDSGVGVRAVSKEKTGFAFCDDINSKTLMQASDAARSIVKSGKEIAPVQFAPVGINKSLYLSDDPLLSIPDEKKIALLRLINADARVESKVKRVKASLSGSYSIILIAASDGTFAADIRPLVRIGVEVLVEHNGRTEKASSGGGGRVDYNSFFNQDAALKYSREAVRQALVALEAKPSPAGPMPVVLGPGWPGVLLHEAVGHGLEGDFNRKKTSTYSGRIGEQVASKLCTIVDDGTLPNRRGSLNIDDEGTKTNCTTLIENGILKGYMQDKQNAALMGHNLTGNGRRESYRSLPMPRMTNTYMLPGKSEPVEIISAVKKGLYAVNFSGGQVDITSGKFVFSANEAYLIENGKITTPVIGATIIGDGPDVMNKISMVGNDLELDDGVGICGKQGQSVPVGVGQPTLLVDEITVGGMAHE